MRSILAAAVLIQPAVCSRPKQAAVVHMSDQPEKSFASATVRIAGLRRGPPSASIPGSAYRAL